MPKTHWNRVCVKCPLGLCLSHSGEWQAFHVSTSGTYWINILTSVSWGREGAEGQRLGFVINKHKQLIKAEWYRFVIHILTHWSILFADDTAIYVHGKDIGRIFNQMRDGLSKLKECFACNRLTLIFFLNLLQYLPWTEKENTPNVWQNEYWWTQYFSPKKTVKYLGLLIDDILNWDDHIDHLVRSLSKFFGIFNIFKTLIPKKLKPLIYNAYVLSKISYGIDIYGSMSDTKCKRPQIISNKLLKILFIMNPPYSTNQLHRDNDMLMVKDLYKSSVLKFVCQSLNQSPLEIFKGYFAKRRDMHNRSLRDLENLHVPESYSGMALTTVKIKGAKIWNEIRKIDETASFKRAVKQHFTSLYT